METGHLQDNYSFYRIEKQENRAIHWVRLMASSYNDAARKAVAASEIYRRIIVVYGPEDPDPRVYDVTPEGRKIYQVEFYDGKYHRKEKEI